MNIMKNKRISDLIRITLSYNNKDISISVNNFIKLNKIKQKAYQLFYPIKSDIKLKYNNKDLSYFLDQSIGLLFENRGKIKLTIEPIIGTRRLLKQVKLNSHKNIFIENTEISKQPLSAERYNTNQTLSINKYNYKGKLPSIINNYSELFLAKELQKGFLSFEICRDCLKNKTNNYCRNCDAFICSKCSNKNHKNHSFIKINLENEKLNIEKYKEELINNFSSAINNLDNLENVKNKEISVDDWKLKYNRAINKLAYISKIKLENIKNDNNKEENKGNNSNEDLDLDKKLKEEKNNIKNIVISIDKDPFKLFKEINEKERIAKQIIKQKNKENNEIDDLFCNLENEIDNIIYDLEEEIFSK